MKITIVKLGDDFIVGEVLQGAGTGRLKLRRPMFIFMTQQGPKIGDILSLLTDDEELVLSENQISYRLNPNDAVAQAYQAVFPDTIVQPSKKLIV
jgi:hypothetical protein